MTGVEPVSVLIADDRPITRSGLAKLLEADPRLRIVGVAADGHQAVQMADQLRPAVVLMDVQMANVDGIDATAELKRKHPEIKVLILSNHDLDGYFTRALQAGARGYMLKDAEPDAIVAGILSVAQGEVVVAGPLSERMVDLFSHPGPAEERYDGLTEREVEILRMLAGGLPTKRVAFTLHISEKTARNHISRIYEKLGIHDRSSAVLYAVSKGLITT